MFDSSAHWAPGGAAGSAHNNTASSQNMHSNSHPERQTGSARATSAQPYRTASIPTSEHSSRNSLPQDLRPVLCEAYRAVRKTRVLLATAISRPRESPSCPRASCRPLNSVWNSHVLHAGKCMHMATSLVHSHEVKDACV